MSLLTGTSIAEEDVVSMLLDSPAPRIWMGAVAHVSPILLCGEKKRSDSLQGIPFIRSWLGIDWIPLVDRRLYGDLYGRSCAASVGAALKLPGKGEDIVGVSTFSKGGRKNGW